MKPGSDASQKKSEKPKLRQKPTNYYKKNSANSTFMSADTLIGALAPATIVIAAMLLLVFLKRKLKF